MEEIIQKTVSNLIEKDFPAFTREEGPVFVEFVKKYYEWLETDEQALYHARRLLEYGDVDETVESFIVHFKQKYLKDIQFETRTNTRQLIKHSLDLYRSKGTERAIELLFALVFGQKAEVYYPADDLFRLSDGAWVKPKYLEITLLDYNTNFVGKQVRGTSSGATAFVERLVRRKFQSKFSEIFYVSAVTGYFTVGEKLAFDGADIEQCPYMIGSLTSLSVTSGGSDFEVGEIVNITSNNGVQGKGRVTDTSDITGIVTFELEDGGFGYTANANVVIASKVLTVSNAVIYEPSVFDTDFPYVRWERITQPVANLQYEFANTIFAVGDTMETYFANGSISGQGYVMVASNTTANAGTVTVAVLQGNLQSNVILRKQGNTKTANLAASGYTDKTAVANLVGWANTLTIDVSNSASSFTVGEVVYQSGLSEIRNGQGVVTGLSGFIANNSGQVFISAANGKFRTDRPLIGETSNNTANVTSFVIKTGVFDISNTFIATNGNLIIAETSNTRGTVTRISSGTGGTFSISNALLYSESVNVSTTYVSPYLNVAIGAATYGLPGNVTANQSNIINPTLVFGNVTIGTITSIVGVNPGEDYDENPIVVINEPLIAPYERHDYVIEYTNASSSFVVGEVVIQNTTGAKFIVKSVANNLIHAKRIQFEDSFNLTNHLVGSATGCTANIVQIVPELYTFPIGINANLSANVVTGAGSVTEMEVYDSGYGYVDDEIASFTSTDGLRSGSVRLTILNQGESEGYYRNKNGFLSDTKYLHDGDYYQEYSYEVRSSVILNKYSDMLKQVLHVSGTKFFGALIRSSEAQLNLNITSNTSIS